MSKKREEDRHRAGGPGKAAKAGHIDPGKQNKPTQKQAPENVGRSGGSGNRGGDDRGGDPRKDD
jgi:hypothetical protein